MILRARRNGNDDRFGIATNVDPIGLTLSCRGEAVKCRADRDRHGTRTADASTRGCFGISGQGEPTLRLKKFGDFGEKRKPVALGFNQRIERIEAFFELRVLRDELDAVVAFRMLIDHAGGVTCDRRVHRDRARMKQI